MYDPVRTSKFSREIKKVGLIWSWDKNNQVAKCWGEEGKWCKYVLSRSTEGVTPEELSFLHLPTVFHLLSKRQCLKRIVVETSTLKPRSLKISMRLHLMGTGAIRVRSWIKLDGIDLWFCVWHCLLMGLIVRSMFDWRKEEKTKSVGKEALTL